jgi:hypothetical protein
MDLSMVAINLFLAVVLYSNKAYSHPDKPVKQYMDCPGEIAYVWNFW